MSAVTAFSCEPDVDRAVAQVAARLVGAAPTAVVYFASPAHPAAALAVAMKRAFPSAQTFGCSTAGEVVSGHLLKGSLVAMALPAAVVADLHVEVVTGLRAGAGPERALAGFERHFGTPVRELDPHRHVGVVLMDGTSLAEERFLDALGDRVDVEFVGGSAGDDLQFKGTSIYANGEAFADAALLAILRPARGFSILKTQSFRASDRRLTATAVNLEQRIVTEFDGRPALDAYADAVGVPVAEAAERFMRNPLGLMAGDEPYVRSPQRLVGEAMAFYCQIREGMELTVLESRDIVADTAAALAAREAEMGGVAAVINFHCILRTLELEQRQQTEAYGQVFSRLPTVGFSTYGEAYIGHINQTSTMLLLR